MEVPTIKPQTPERHFGAEFSALNVIPEMGEQTYHDKPVDPGFTDMTKRREAIASLLQADANNATGGGTHHWWKN